jgi:hypothetical protein
MNLIITHIKRKIYNEDHCEQFFFLINSLCVFQMLGYKRLLLILMPPAKKQPSLTHFERLSYIYIKFYLVSVTKLIFLVLNKIVGRQLYQIIKLLIRPQHLLYLVLSIILDFIDVIIGHIDELIIPNFMILREVNFNEINKMNKFYYFLNKSL